MMKTRTMTALAVVLLAAASLPAAAQERGERGGRERTGPRAEFRQERGPTRGLERARPDGGERRGWNERPSRGPETRAAPQAAPMAQAPDAARPARPARARGDQSDMWRSDRHRGEQRGERTWDRAGDGARRGPASGAAAPDRPEPRWQGRRDNDDRRDLGDRGRDGRWDGDRGGRGPGARDNDRRGWDGRWSHQDRARWDRDDRDRDRRRGDRPYWSQGRYPFSYSSPRRYRGPGWAPPPGFYFRTWSMGDYLPWGWYGASYRLNDWWSYGLPWPPPGYDWVRNGPDVLLVDRFTGRIVQVVRMLFW